MAFFESYHKVLASCVGRPSVGCAVVGNFVAYLPVLSFVCR
jgi:hypothetical protein